jgi:hypothetical protein
MGWRNWHELSDSEREPAINLLKRMALKVKQQHARTANPIERVALAEMSESYVSALELLEAKTVSVDLSDPAVAALVGDTEQGVK